MFKERIVIVNEETINEALEWLNKWSHSTISSTNQTGTIEATLKALQDTNVKKNNLKFQNLKSKTFFKIIFRLMLFI